MSSQDTTGEDGMKRGKILTRDARHDKTIIKQDMSAAFLVTKFIQNIFLFNTTTTTTTTTTNNNILQAKNKFEDTKGLIKDSSPRASTVVK
jgi:hypothetical protein